MKAKHFEREKIIEEIEHEDMYMKEMRELLLLDMKDTLNNEAVKNFERKGFYAL
jgi:hypothetical protein